MSFVNNFQSMTSEQAKKMVSDLLDTRAIDAIADMKNEATQLDETKFINVATSQKEIDAAKKALAYSPDMFHGAKAGFKRVITQHQKFIDNQKPVKEDTAQLDESFTVHVRSYSSKPDKKDTDHVKSGVELHNGVYDGASDKGSYFKFKTESEAKKFKSHVDKSPNKTVAGDLQED
jgi:hypothetical protein